MPLRSGLFLPLFDELADPATVARLSFEAEGAGWHGLFVWDHVRWPEPVLAVADPWITLAAVATTTERVRLGPMVTPPAGEGCPGDCDARPAQRRPAHARGRPGQRPVRGRVLDHRRRTRRSAARTDARRVPRHPCGRLVG